MHIHIHWALLSVFLLFLSNVFMNFAWYAHLKVVDRSTTIFIAILVSWLIALGEYVLQVPAIRVGFQRANLSLGQLKIIEESLALLVFIPFSIYYMKEPITLNFLYATICICLGIYFIFK